MKTSPNSPKPICYVASPYGFAESTKHWYTSILLPVLNKYVDVIDPWLVDGSHIFAAPKEDRQGLWMDIGDAHFSSIERAWLIIAFLDQEPPDGGTVCEVAWAAAHEIPVIGYRNDFRTSGEDGMPFNLMIAAAIRKSGGVMVASLDELEKQLKRPGTPALKRVLSK